MGEADLMLGQALPARRMTWALIRSTAPRLGLLAYALRAPKFASPIVVPRRRGRSRRPRSSRPTTNCRGSSPSSTGTAISSTGRSTM